MQILTLVFMFITAIAVVCRKEKNKIDPYA